MHQILQNYDTGLQIPVLPHPDLGAPRRLQLAMLVVRTSARSIEVAWDLQTLDAHGRPVTRLTERLTQSASDASIVILQNGAPQGIISREEFNRRFVQGPEKLDKDGNPTGQFEPPPEPEPQAWATEYDFWWATACGNNPPQMHLLLHQAGLQFAARRELL